jgi:ABC-type glycerol-3-phosphate transport system substrate-binding protein
VVHAEPDDLDVLRFEQLLRRARRLVPTDPREAATSLEEALALWSGSPLSDLSEAPSLTGEIARLNELRVSAVEDLLGARLAVGDHAEVLPELERLVVEHPMRERLWGHLMLARYRSGRQAEALDAYRRAQDLLADELGIDPSPELQELQRRILQQDPALQLTGKPLRGYRLLERVGEGAFGVVWRALDPELGREVGVKQIHPKLSDDPSFVRRFEQEAQTIARLEHPHVVPLYDYWRDGSGAYLVMRWMRGGSLEDVLVGGKPDPEHAAQIVDQLAGALSSAHRAHTVHRDVKPANVLLDEDGNAYLSDFGIAQDLADWRDSVPAEGLGYSSPEQLRGEEVTPSSDIYALGMLAQDLLNGRGRDPRVAGVIDRATADRPGDRYVEASELARALREALGFSVRTARPAVESEERNPYKGLHAFAEADADDFFGRDGLVDGLIARLAEPVGGARFLAVVGPSGSGKSSVVRAGLIPTLRAGALAGSERWFYAEMLPGAHPFEELELALQQVAVSPPADLLETLERSEEGLAEVVGQILPDDGTELVLVVDQLEEVFTMVEDEQTRDRFLQSLVEATSSPGARIRVIVTLRADFFDRPLTVAGLAELMRTRTATVVPLIPEEIERAIDGPADRVGVTPELALVAEMVADVSERPGALPLLQFALTELFERRRGSVMTLEAYRQIGGVSGALARRAEELYEGLNREGRRASKQLFLRLVTLGEGIADTRRLVGRAELLSLPLERRAIEGVIDLFGRHRLLAFDRDPATRGPTVEVAHEALLGSWDRLRIWIDDARTDLLQHRRLAAAAGDWDASGRDPALLPRGRRLEELSALAASSELALSRDEQEYVSSGERQRDQELAEERARAERERALERRSVVRLRALVAVMAAAALVAAGLTAVAVSRAGEAERRRDEFRVSGLTGAALSNLVPDPDLSLVLALHAVSLAASLDEPVPAEAVEALHWSMQQAGVEYPATDGPIAVVAGPLGTRGVLDLPLPRLVDAATAQSLHTLSPAECSRYLRTRNCPPRPDVLPADVEVEPITPVRPSTGAPSLAGTRVTLHWPNIPEFVLPPLLEELSRFTSRTGVEVELVEFPQIEGWISQGDAVGRPPDLIIAQPGAVAELARNDHLIDMRAFLDVEDLREAQSPYLVELGTVGTDGSWPSSDGGLFGAFEGLNVKSLIWYPVPELGAGGYPVPKTWDELVDLTGRLRADGRTPWCLGWVAGGDADGFLGTDWIENLLLATDPGAYDRWTSHDLKFDSPAVRSAFERLGTILFTPGNVHERAAEFPFFDAMLPMVDRNPPGCWLNQSPTFMVEVIGGAVGKRAGVFPFPSVNDRSRGWTLGSGGMIASFADRPEVRELIRLLLSADHGAGWGGIGGQLSPNRGFDPANFGEGTWGSFWRSQAKLLRASLDAGTFRFDASDLMPPEVGEDAFWDAMMTYLEEGPESLDRILADIDAAWPDAS